MEGQKVKKSDSQFMSQTMSDGKYENFSMGT